MGPCILCTHRVSAQLFSGNTFLVLLKWSEHLTAAGERQVEDGIGGEPRLQGDSLSFRLFSHPARCPALTLLLAGSPGSAVLTSQFGVHVTLCEWGTTYHKFLLLTTWDRSGGFALQLRPGDALLPSSGSNQLAVGYS